jgi:peptidoglycan hydrolase CwlO-like protein
VLLEYMLFQFFHIEKNLDKDRKLVENGNKQLADLDKSRDDVETRFKKLKARQAKSHQKTLDFEKQLRQKERELRKKVSQLHHQFPQQCACVATCALHRERELMLCVVCSRPT